MSDNIDLGQWVGRRRIRTDWVNPNRVAAWNATLDRDDAFPKQGEAVPPGFHWTLFPTLERQSELGEDGHAKRGSFLPPVQLAQRMWAGSRLKFHQPLRIGDQVEQLSMIIGVAEKQGRDGTLIFVTVRHVISVGNVTALEEEQDLVYRDKPRIDSSGRSVSPEHRLKGTWNRQIIPHEVLLFRYSALTFNGHRIHYDRRFASNEGYPGLVVHGPLIATFLLDLVRRNLPPTAILERFYFKALRPTFDTSPFTVEGDPVEGGRQVRLWSTDNLGQLGVEAEASIR